MAPGDVEVGDHALRIEPKAHLNTSLQAMAPSYERIEFEGLDAGKYRCKIVLTRGQILHAVICSDRLAGLGGDLLTNLIYNSLLRIGNGRYLLFANGRYNGFCVMTDGRLHSPAIVLHRNAQRRRMCENE